MKKAVAACLLGTLLAGNAMARNTTHMLNWSDAVESSEAKALLDDSVKLKFGAKSAPAGAQAKGEHTANSIEKGKDDIEACRKAAVRALLELQHGAKRADADAVVNIISYYKKTVFSSATQYECHAGGTGGHITFKGDFVKLRK